MLKCVANGGMWVKPKNWPILGLTSATAWVDIKYQELIGELSLYGGAHFINLEQYKDNKKILKYRGWAE